ncbi:unnamed protein product, partial [Prorocentrum cordatum]
MITKARQSYLMFFAFRSTVSRMRSGPTESSAGCVVLSQFPADKLDLSRGKELPSSRIAASMINVGLSIPWVVASVYLHTSVGLAGENIELLGKLFQAAGKLQFPWIVAADWNMLPSDVDKWAKLVHGEIIASGGPTCGARELDFFICSRVLAPFAESVYLVSEAPAKSHAPVALKLSGIGVQVKVP